MFKGDFSSVPIARKGDKNAGKQLKQLINTIQEKYKVEIADYYALHKWSIDNTMEFWSKIWDFTGIVYSKRFEQVIDLNLPMGDLPEWFQGARLNYAENLLKFRDDRVALINASEDEETRIITFAKMYEETMRYAAAFSKLGLKKGDRVACYISNREEPVFAMLAVVSIGAIWTGALPLLGPQAVLHRLQQISPKFLLTIDGFSNNGTKIEMLNKVKDVVNGLPSLEKVIIVPSSAGTKPKDISYINNSCFLEDFLRFGREEDGSIPPLEFEQVSFSHPVFINFTSGTTGLPKALVHGCGALMPSIINFWLQLDGDRESVWFSMSPVGWVSWNMVLGTLFSGSSILLFEGVPYFLSKTFFWDLLDKYDVTDLFLASNVVDEMEKGGYEPTERHKLSSVKNVLVGGSVVKPKCYDFFYNRIKKDVLFSATYGFTELIGCTLSAVPTLDIYRGEMPIVCLGMDLRCVNEEGQVIEGEYGDLIIAKPSPCFLVGIWGVNDRSICKKKYFNKYNGSFVIGDYAIVNPTTKGYIICGRSDDTLKQRGTRFGSSEMYHVVDIFPEVEDSLCVSQYNKELDERAVLFVKMKKGHVFNGNLVARVREAISRELTPFHVPDIIIETQGIPYNANGKKLEIIVKKIINNRTFNVENVINPESLENYYDNPYLQGF